MRVFGPGPTRMRGLVGAQHGRGDDQGADQHVHAADRLRGAGDHGVHEPVRRAGPGQRLDDPRAPLDRDVVHDQQEHAPGLQVRPVGHRAGLPGPGRRRRGVHPPAPARDRVPVVLRDRRGDRRGVDELVRRDHAEVVRVREVPRRTRTRPSGNSGSLLSGFSLQARCAPGAPGCFPCLFFPLPRPGLGSGAVFPGRSSADGGIPEFPEFRDTARSSLASRSARSVTCAVSSAFRASPGPRSARPEAQPARRGHHQARPRSQQAIIPAATPRPARKPPDRSANVTSTCTNPPLPKTPTGGT